jgi:DNA invertase Pin-like site-specific DNA recombinase
MARTFAYCRVSTLSQTVENQIREIEAAGFRVEKRRLVTETVSGNSAIEQRPGFMKLPDRLERDDVLVVTKLDRLGRNSIDVQTTVKRFDEMGVRARRYRFDIESRRIKLETNSEHDAWWPPRGRGAEAGIARQGDH